MKKLLLISMLIGAMPLAMMAQDDDLYFVPKKKKAQVEKVKDITPVVAPQPKAKSSYEVIDGDTTKLDVIDFTEGKGVYPADTLEAEDYALTKNMVRFDDYDVSSNEAFWAGYRAGSSTWGWHSPWYYHRYGWYDPWYYGSWYGSMMWGNPYYLSWWDPYYYGWYDSWYWPYYGHYGYFTWYSPYHYYGYPYYYGGGGSTHYYGRTGNAGTIDIKGSTGHRASYRNSVANNSTRMSSLRERAREMGGSRVYTSGNSQRSASGNFSGRRGGNNNSNYNYSSPTRSSNSSYSSGSSFGGSRSSSSGGSFGGSRSSGGGGGGSRMGGRR